MFWLLPVLTLTAMVEVRAIFERVRGLIEESARARGAARESHLELLALLREQSLRTYSPHDRHYWELRRALGPADTGRAVHR